MEEHPDDRHAHLTARLLGTANMLMAEGFTRAEIAEAFLDFAVMAGSKFDPVGIAERCVAAARVLTRQAEETAQQQAADRAAIRH